MAETLFIAVFGVLAASLLRGFTGFGWHRRRAAAEPGAAAGRVVPFVVVLQVIGRDRAAAVACGSAIGGRWAA
jgi:hypothetical protein